MNTACLDARGRWALAGWLAGCMVFLWVTGFSFFPCVASPFHSFVTALARWFLGAHQRELDVTNV